MSMTIHVLGYLPVGTTKPYFIAREKNFNSVSKTLEGSEI